MFLLTFFYIALMFRKYFFIVLLGCLGLNQVTAQQLPVSDPRLSYKAIEITSPKGIKVNLADLPDLPDARIISLHPEVGSNPIKLQKLALDKQRLNQPSTKALQKKANVLPPTVGRNFNGNVTQGTPNDNDMAIGNNGMVVSVVNTNMNVYNDTGRFIIGRTLSTLGNAIGPLNRTFDPRVIYDPESDRFIIVFLQGSTSVDSRIVVCFSETNDPSKTWNVYALPGNFVGDSSWSDYPIISLSKEDLFVTVNRLKDNTSWQEGFIESYIWQVEKAKGYAGDSLNQKVYQDIQFNGKKVWSICPVKGGSKLYGPFAYFLSQRPSALSNDTLFVHYITNSLSSGKSSLGMKVVKSNTNYGLQPNAIMPNGKKLQTNDSRVLSAMYENGVIYYVGNSIDFNLFSPAVYFGRVHEVWTNKPRVEASIISSDTLDFGYPSIAYVGSGLDGDHRSMITFSHVSPAHFPGTSVVYVDKNFNVSAPVFVKQGEGNIRIIQDSVERWGDYTGIQKKYNENGVAWLNGSFGNANGQNRTWIGRVSANDPSLSLKDNLNKANTIVYPNPGNDQVSFEFESDKKELVTISIIDMKGGITTALNKEFAKPGLNKVVLDISKLQNGVYVILLTNEYGKITQHKFVVSH
jgi:hypothetical protein